VAPEFWVKLKELNELEANPIPTMELADVLEVVEPLAE
jgi:hypothetical protein